MAVAREEGDTDTGMHAHAAARDLEALAGRRDQFLGDDHRHRQLLDLRQQHDELVAAGARHDVVVAQDARKALRDPPQQRIAVRVAEEVVDLLEAVEVEHHQGRLAALAQRHGQQAARVLDQQAAVRQAGQFVVVGLVPGQFLAPLQRRDVGQHENAA